MKSLLRRAFHISLISLAGTSINIILISFYTKLVPDLHLLLDIPTLIVIVLISIEISVKSIDVIFTKKDF